MAAPTLAPVRAVGVHHPDVRVLHRRLEIGEAALGRLERDRLAVGRPARMVFVALGRGQPADRLVGELQREEVVVEELVVVGSRFERNSSSSPFGDQSIECS